MPWHQRFFQQLQAQAHSNTALHLDERVSREGESSISLRTPCPQEGNSEQLLHHRLTASLGVTYFRDGIFGGQGTEFYFWVWQVLCMRAEFSKLSWKHRSLAGRLYLNIKYEIGSICHQPTSLLCIFLLWRWASLKYIVSNLLLKVDYTVLASGLQAHSTKTSFQNQKLLPSVVSIQSPSPPPPTSSTGTIYRGQEASR